MEGNSQASIQAQTPPRSPNPVGRPRTITTPEEMDRLVDEYIALHGPENQRPPTLTGMIRHLGLSSRESFDEYGRRKDFSDSVKRAKLFIEQAYEERLHGNAATGAIFGLKNFGWKDERSATVNHNITLSGMLAAVVDGDDEPEMIDVTPDAPAIEDGGNRDATPAPEPE